MKESRVPFKKIIFVCAHTREGEAACANADRGANKSSDFIEPLREEVRKRGLKGKIRIAKSGCMDLCAKGPNLMVFDENGNYTLYSEVTPTDLATIVDKHFNYG